VAASALPGNAMPPAQSYSIGELAREFGVTIRTIRFYEDQGLITPERRGTTRVYSPADRVTLILILRGKRLGFTLAESREMISLYDPASGNTTQLERMLAKLAEKRAMLERQMEDIRLLQAEFDVAESRVRDALTEAKKPASKTPKTRPAGAKP
jgi:DNA-binding transcriptional MerR regulator